MSAQKRKESEAGIYHAISRGVERRPIFLDRRDRIHFLELLEAVSREFDVSVGAWCLMGNHYHLLVTCDIAKLSAMMHKLNVSYAMYFNTKYERDGHLFQGRFKSVPVNSDEQYLTVLRYIHQNPEKAGICPTVAYPWSSYRSYIRGSGIASRELALSLLGGIEEFEAFHRNLENDTVLSCLLDGETLSEEELEDVARDVLCGVNPQDIRTFSPSERREFIRELKRAHLTVRQIENLTGISRSTISRVK